MVLDHGGEDWVVDYLRCGAVGGGVGAGVGACSGGC